MALRALVAEVSRTPRIAIRILVLGAFVLAGCRVDDRIDVEDEVKRALGSDKATIKVSRGWFGISEATGSVLLGAPGGDVAAVDDLARRLSEMGWSKCNRPEFGRWIGFDDAASGAAVPSMQYEQVFVRNHAIAELIARKSVAATSQRVVIRIRTKSDRPGTCTDQ